ARRVRPRVGRVGREEDHSAPVGNGRGDPRGRRRARDPRDLPVSEQTIRDAMVPEPMTLGVDATAQDAGRCFAENDEVRALFVVDADGRLAGVLTRKTLVREVVAAGRSPADVPLREIAEPPHFTLDASLSLDTGFHQLDEKDMER